MANVYIDTLEPDTALLQTLLYEHSTTNSATLAMVHKIKGSTARLGLRTINQSAIYTEKLGKLASPDYPTALSSLVKEVKQSIVDVKNWKARNAKKANSPKVYSY
ncbi:Hpt domain-containing protein [Vibrio natriegens]|uniref:Hpt domain-containing protein n=1 Tax=Vibrio natriegens TaxID=691 RepID=UPI0021E915A6|nr:Hpt domain-containing protein [Vibrio natriegens]UYI49807.1 Hpt domain-containing protein [Vibrio natriegens]